MTLPNLDRYLTEPPQDFPDPPEWADCDTCDHRIIDGTGHRWRGQYLCDRCFAALPDVVTETAP